MLVDRIALLGGDGWGNDSLRQLERDSIRAYVESASCYFHGTVLDYGCGNQPYRGVIEDAGGTYTGYDRASFPGAVRPDDVGPSEGWASVIGRQRWDAIVCNQIIQFVPRAQELLNHFEYGLVDGGVLVMTYPTCWAEVEPEDLHRFTRAGMERLLKEAGFEVANHERRAGVSVGGFVFPFGYGVTALARS